MQLHGTQHPRVRFYSCVRFYDKIVGFFFLRELVAPLIQCRALMFATLSAACWLGYAGQRRPPAVGGRRPTPTRVAVAHRMAVGSPTGSPSEIGERWRREQAAAANDASPVGVLLLSVGAPASADDVEEYLYNVFCDPEILTLPPALMWALKRPVAWVIAKTRAPAARAAMLEASPNTTQVIQAMANQLGSVLGEQDVKSKVGVGATGTPSPHPHPYQP